jgi:hypothetical protein
MADESRQSAGTDPTDDRTEEGAREQGVRTERSEDLSSPLMTSREDEDEGAAHR